MRKSMNAVLAGLVVGTALIGCASSAISYKHAYDPAADFSEPKTYAWITSWSQGTADGLLEANITFHADRALEAKGWKKDSAQPSLLFAVSLEHDYSDAYLLRFLSLRAARRDTGKAVWRGTAAGSLDSSADTTDLQDAVNGILSSFPPK